MKFLKPLLVALALCAGALGSPLANAAASCSLTSNGGQALRAGVGVTTITAATNAPPGTVLATRDVPLASLSYTCGANISAELRMALATGSAATAVDNVYSTSLPGLGYRVRWPSTTWWPNAVRCVASQTSSCTVAASSLRVEFVQTGPIQAGTIPAGTVLGTVSLLAQSEASNTVNALNVVLDTPITVTVNTCAVTSDVRVDLGSYTVDHFATRSTTDRVTVPLVFNCPVDSAVSITFNGTAPFGSSARGLIENTGTARNVAVQLLDSSGLSGVRLGQANSLGRINGSRTVNYNARMYRLENDVSAGDVDAYVVFTLNIS